MDLRYLNKRSLFFVAIAHLTLENEIDHSYIGWYLAKINYNVNYFHNIFDCYKIHINYDANIGENLI